MSRRSPEKAVQAAGDELMELFGFTSIHFSQARATQQTEGIPDRRYYLEWVPTWKLANPLYGNGPFVIWWEAKAATKQSKHQRAFQELVTACGETYLLGGVEALEQYLCAIGLARRVPGGIEGLRQRSA